MSAQCCFQMGLLVKVWCSRVERGQVENWRRKITELHKMLLCVDLNDFYYITKTIWVSYSHTSCFLDPTNTLKASRYITAAVFLLSRNNHILGTSHLITLLLTFPPPPPKYTHTAKAAGFFIYFNVPISLNFCSVERFVPTILSWKGCLKSSLMTGGDPSSDRRCWPAANNTATMR